MQPLDLNLASRPFKNNTLLWVAFALAVLSLAAVTVQNVRAYRRYGGLLADLQSQVGSNEAQLAELDRREQKAQAEIAKFNVEVLDAKAGKANDVILWKAFSWTRLFNLLQDVLPYDVQLSSIHPAFRPESDGDDSRGTVQVDSVPVTVEGTAKSYEAFLDLESALYRDPHFSSVQPQGHDKDENTAETIFRLRFNYDPTASPSAPPAPLEAASPGEGEPAPPPAPGGEALAADADADAASPAPEGAGAATGPPRSAGRAPGGPQPAVFHGEGR